MGRHTNARHTKGTQSALMACMVLPCMLVISEMLTCSRDEQHCLKPVGVGSAILPVC